MAPEDERKSIWAAVGLNSDRITALEAIVKDRDESMREMIREAVRDAMPKTMLSDGEHDFLRMLMGREERRAKFQQKIIDSSVVWAVPALLGGTLWVLWKLVHGWLVAHGLWRD